MKKAKKILINTAALSDIGKVRKSNEDSFFISKDENLIIVCDGMGGQVAGGLASKIAVETIKDIFYSFNDNHINKIFIDMDSNLSFTIRLLVAAVRIANRRLYNMAIKFPKLRGMGTTVVALTVDSTAATMVHVGDSRIFRMSDGHILQLTEDHSWLNELIEDNEINAEQIETFTQKNVITRALGTAPTVKIDVHYEKYKKNDLYIVSTDGLHNSVKKEDMKLLYEQNQGALETLTKKLIEKAKSRDGSDNITVTLAKINQDSSNSNLVGISTTISGEDEKVIVREDKFIQEHYEDTKFRLFNLPQMNIMNQQKLVMFGFFIITALLCFLLGMNFSSVKQNVPAKKPGMDIANKNTKSTSSKSLHNNSTDQVPKRTNHQNQIVNQMAPIQQSKLGKDAVLAFVLFNNLQDFNNARLMERGLVLDKMFPYLKTQQPNQFSIFLIDSTNNVIWKTAGIKLPKMKDL